MSVSVQGTSSNRFATTYTSPPTPHQPYPKAPQKSAASADTVSISRQAQQAYQVSSNTKLQSSAGSSAGSASVKFTGKA